MNPQISLSQLLNYIWRAEASDPESDLGSMLMSPVIGECLRIVEQAESPRSALEAFTKIVVRSRASSLASEAARRAAVACFSSHARRSAFVEALFAEASDYLISRDISPLVGLSPRFPAVSNVIETKDELVELVREVVRHVGDPPADLAPEGWSSYVSDVLQELRYGRD
jgi:hypothetical protein